MNTNKLTNLQISERVRDELRRKKMSLRKCCESFNELYKVDIADGFPALDKDFVQRIKKNKFEVSSDRVSKLCDFLGIEVSSHIDITEQKLSKEFIQIEDAIQDNPALEKQVRALLKNIAQIAMTSKLQGR